MNGSNAKIRTLLIMSLAVAWCCGTAVTADTKTSDTKGGDTEKVDANTYGAIQTIRREIGLSSRTIAAMGCDHAAAKEVLETLLLWYRVKEPYLYIAERGIRRARYDLREAVRKMGTGPRDEELFKSVPALKAAIPRAAKDYEDILKTGITAIEAKLSPVQKVHWATARANAKLPSGYREAAKITAPRIRPKRRRRPTYIRKVVPPKTSAGKAAVTSESKAKETNVLLAARKAAMAQVAENIRKNMSAVWKAEREVLPLPDELKEPEPDMNPPEDRKP